jgi:hypothetical protein
LHFCARRWLVEKFCGIFGWGYLETHDYRSHCKGAPTFVDLTCMLCRPRSSKMNREGSKSEYWAYIRYRNAFFCPI